MTRMLVLTRAAAGAAMIGGLLLAAHPAQAQVGNMLTGAVSSGNVGAPSRAVRNPDDYYRKQALPPGLPGARSTPDGAAPAHKLAAEMKPTDALFDAVNRGDSVAVREALGRGADVNAHNILGLTPVDLSVDLGHSSITFVLLSVRKAAPAPTARQAAARAAAKAEAVHVRRAPLTPVRGDGARQAAMTPRPAPVRPAPRPAPRPQVMADDGGTPRPAVGFLGFGR